MCLKKITDFWKRNKWAIADFHDGNYLPVDRGESSIFHIAKIAVHHPEIRGNSPSDGPVECISRSVLSEENVVQLTKDPCGC
jgi:hypothetical protein